jgi:hypothetical protein
MLANRMTDQEKDHAAERPHSVYIAEQLHQSIDLLVQAICDLRADNARLAERVAALERTQRAECRAANEPPASPAFDFVPPTK